MCAAVVHEVDEDRQCWPPAAKSVDGNAQTVRGPHQHCHVRPVHDDRYGQSPPKSGLQRGDSHFRIRKTRPLPIGRRVMHRKCKFDEKSRNEQAGSRSTSALYAPSPVARNLVSDRQNIARARSRLITRHTPAPDANTNSKTVTVVTIREFHYEKLQNVIISPTALHYEDD